MESDIKKVEVSPPTLIDWCIHALMPPVAREATLGDLCELSESRAKYIRNALQVLPFIVLSQARRTLNLPALGLQAFVLYACLGGFSPFSFSSDLWLVAGISTIAALLGLILRDVYRTTEERSFKRALLDTAVAVSCMMLAQSIVHGILYLGFGHPAMLVLGATAFPIICVLRVDWGLDAYTHAPRQAGPVTCDSLRQDYEQFERRVRLRNRAEIAACVATASLGIVYHLNFKSALRPIGWATVAILVCIIGYLIARGAAKRASVDLDFQTLLKLHKRELIRQHAIRRFMCWWWFAPLLIGLAINFIARGYKSQQPLVAVAGFGLVLLLCLCVSSINRNRGLNIEAKIKSLATLSDERACQQ